MLARRRKNEGKIDFAEFIANRGEKAVEDALKVGWEMEEAEQKLERSKLTRLQILYAKLNEPYRSAMESGWRWPKIFYKEMVFVQRSLRKPSSLFWTKTEESTATYTSRGQRTAVKHFY